MFWLLVVVVKKFKMKVGDTIGLFEKCEEKKYLGK